MTDRTSNLVSRLREFDWYGPPRKGADELLTEAADQIEAMAAVGIRQEREIERLRERVKDLQQFHDWAEPQVHDHGRDVLEIERLRAALASIGEYDCPGGVSPKHCLGCAACDANKALEGLSVETAGDDAREAARYRFIRQKMTEKGEVTYYSMPHSLMFLRGVCGETAFDREVDARMNGAAFESMPPEEPARERFCKVCHSDPCICAGYEYCTNPVCIKAHDDVVDLLRTAVTLHKRNCHCEACYWIGRVPGPGSAVKAT